MACMPCMAGQRQSTCPAERQFVVHHQAGSFSRQAMGCCHQYGRLRSVQMDHNSTWRHHPN